MTISATFANAQRQDVIAVIDGTKWHVSQDAIASRDGMIAIAVAEWIDAGNATTEFQAPAPKTSDIKSEAGRRIEARYPLWKQINIMRSGDGLAAMTAFIDAVRSASNALEATLPSDYQADKHWPA